MSCGNLLTDSNFEIGTGWTKGGTEANITYPSTDMAWDGSSSIKVVESNSNCYAYQDITVTPGDVLQLSVYIQLSARTLGGLWIKMASTSWSTFSQSSGVTTTGTWQRVSCSYTVEAGVTTVRVMLDSYDSADLTGYFDAVMLEKNSTVSAYCPVINIPAPPTPPNIDSTFVTSFNGQFSLNNNRFRFIGINNYPLIQDENTIANLDSFFANCVTDGINVVRTWCYNRASEPTDNTGFNRYESGGVLNWRESWFTNLDLVLARAKVAGVKLSLVLVDNWPTYNNWGIKQQYCYWSNTIHSTAYDRYDTGDEFYIDTNIRQWYKDYIDKLTARVNTVNGLTYSSDPTIFAWELGNELRFVGGVDTSVNTLNSYRLGILNTWLTEMSAHIKSKDSNHLVGSGSLSQFYDWVADDSMHNGTYYGEDYTSQHQDTNIDYYDFHQYSYTDSPEFALHNYGQYAGKGLGTYDGWLYQLLDYITIAKANGKPVVIGEWGVDKRNTTLTPLVAYPRVSHFTEVFNQFFGNDGDGLIIWHYTNLFDDNNYNIKPDGVHTGSNANSNLNDDDTSLRDLIRSTAVSFGQVTIPPPNRFSLKHHININRVNYKKTDSFFRW